MASSLTKPSSLICPGHYCFFWRKAGTKFAAGLHDNLEAAIEAAVEVTEDRCGCSFGTCLRLEPAAENRDWYEPHEPNLEAAGLPWFFFIPDPYKLSGKARKRYIQQSEQLWGRRHWEQ